MNVNKPNLKTQDNYSSMGERDKPISYNAMSAAIEAGLEWHPQKSEGRVVRDHFPDRLALGRLLKGVLGTF